MSRFEASCSYADVYLDPITAPPPVGEPPPPDTPPPGDNVTSCIEAVADYAAQVRNTTNSGTLTVTCFTQDYYSGQFYYTFIKPFKELSFSHDGTTVPDGLTYKKQLPYRANAIASCDDGNSIINHNFYYVMTYNPLSSDGFIYKGGHNGTACSTHQHPHQYVIRAGTSKSGRPVWLVARKDFEKDPSYGDSIATYFCDPLIQRGNVFTLREQYEEWGWGYRWYAFGTHGFWIRYKTGDPVIYKPLFLPARDRTQTVGIFYSNDEVYIVKGDRFFKVVFSDISINNPRFLLSDKWIVIVRERKAHCIDIETLEPKKTLSTGTLSVQIDTWTEDYGQGDLFELREAYVNGANAKYTLCLEDGAERIGDFFVYSGHVFAANTEFLAHNGTGGIYNNPDPDFGGEFYFSFEENFAPIPKKVSFNSNGEYLACGRYQASCPVEVSPPEISLESVTVPWSVAYQSLAEEYFEKVEGDEHWAFTCAGITMYPNTKNEAGLLKETKFTVP